MSQTLNIVADGDSWFDYSKILGTGGGLIDHLETVSGLSITNYAHAGDSTLEALGLKKSQRLEKVLKGADILLFSGGGDDIAGDQLCLGVNQFEEVYGDVTKAVNQDWLAAVVAVIVNNYRDLVKLRDRISPECWIVIHSYDFPDASMMGKGVGWFNCVAGPWIQPGMNYCGWRDPKAMAAIIKEMLLALKAAYVAFAAANRKVKHVDLQGTGGAGDWDNEIHKNSGGWHKSAQVMNLALLPLLDLPAKTLAAADSPSELPTNSHYDGAESS